MSAADWAWALTAALCVGMSKTGFGGLGMVAVLIMASIMPARASTGIVLPMLIMADVFAIFVFRRHAIWSHVWRLLPPAVVGVVTGWLLMPVVPDLLFAPLIGWVTLGLLVLLIFVQRARLAESVGEHPGVAWPAGWFAGVTTMIANAAGPVMTIYLLACRLPKMEFVGTGAWYFFIVNLMKVPFSVSLGLITLDSLWFNLQLAPAVLVGGIAGRWLLTKIPQRPFEWLLMLFTLVGALHLILR